MTWILTDGRNLIGDTRFDQGFIAEAMPHAGFRSVRSRTVHTFAGDMDLDVGRK